MSEKYTSVLMCFHEKLTQVYVEGLPIGTIEAGEFKPHCSTLPDGSKRTVEPDAGTMLKVRCSIDAIHDYIADKFVAEEMP